MNPIASVGNMVSTAREQLFPQDAPVCGITRLIGVVLGANVNQTNTDIAVPLILLPGANFIIDSVLINNASISLTTATFGVFSAVSAGGVTIVTAAAVLSGLTTTTSNLVATLAATATTTVLNQTTVANNLYFRVGTAQGAAATCDVYIWGKVLT
jgi:hypothetical protein